MSVETNDGYGNGELIKHSTIPSVHLCIKCKLQDMKPTFHPKASYCKFNRYIENIKNFMKNDTYYNSDEVIKEHIVWSCPECGFQIAKPIEP